MALKAIGIVGCGAIGKALVKAVEGGKLAVRVADLIVGAAGGHVVADLAKKIFAAGKNLMVISVGALLDQPEIIQESRSSLRVDVWGKSRSPRTQEQQPVRLTIPRGDRAKHLLPTRARTEAGG